ncbi:GTP pyrophosphokinase [Agrobacterium rosae]|uniref:GTP pyrophosphokinase n=1 Tax=Agrobacterium rosae TaxID=1972867 RepID=A0AAE5S1U8_9HYPH|nr:GTP pyrophosphokinase [Agrobacterium rosae]POO54321.1 GTP pyrophosphokinase [Agrobacterium rosae]
MDKKIKSAEAVEPNDKVEGFASWLKDKQSAHGSLKDAAITIIGNLVRANGIDVLAVSGRLKDIDSAIEKVRRKEYTDPQSQMTDVVGIRVIVYFEGDVKRVSDIIRRSFNVDEANSSNTDERMLPNQVGYRSVHFVCDLGDDRVKLPEFEALSGLKFEFQIRTVLQHAWAELAHDNNYKFSGSLPRPLERHLFLLAGLLETADQGFNDLSAKIDDYKIAVSDESAKGELDIAVDSLSLETFLTQWAKDEGYTFREVDREAIPARLIKELEEFGIETLAQLKDIIPHDFVKFMSQYSAPSTMLTVVRMWMIIHDSDRIASKVHHRWTVEKPLKGFLNNYFPEERVAQIVKTIRDSQDLTIPKPKL